MPQDKEPDTGPIAHVGEIVEGQGLARTYAIPADPGRPAAEIVQADHARWLAGELAKLKRAGKLLADFERHLREMDGMRGDVARFDRYERQASYMRTELEKLLRGEP